MLTLLGIILIHQNGLKWWKTLDIALSGNRAPSLPGRPKYGIYVTAEGHGLSFFTREFRGRVRDRLILNGQAT